MPLSSPPQGRKWRSGQFHMPPQSRERVSANDKHDITIIIIIHCINDKFRMISCTVIRRRKYKIQNNSNNNNKSNIIYNYYKISVHITYAAAVSSPVIYIYIYILYTSFYSSLSSSLPISHVHRISQIIGR